MAESDCPTSSCSSRARVRRSFSWARSELGRELLQVGAGAEILFETALQLPLQAQGVADGQQGQEDAAAEGDGEGGDQGFAEVFGGGGDLALGPIEGAVHWRWRCGRRSGAWRCGAGSSSS